MTLSNRRCDAVTVKPAVFVAVKSSNTVMRGAEFICTACSHNFAKRIANALNIYRPSKKGH